MTRPTPLEEHPVVVPDRRKGELSYGIEEYLHRRNEVGLRD